MNEPTLGNKSEHVAVFFHSSNEYSPIMSVTMASILYNTKSFIDFYVIETGISDFNKREIEKMKEKFPHFSIEWIKFEYNDIFKKEYFAQIPTHVLNGPWPSVHGFCTPFMPLVKPEVDKFIYLDLDTIVLGDIKELYDEDMEDYALAAVPDVVIPLYVNELIMPINKNIHYETFGKYFNAGVLLVNAKKFRDDNIIEKYFSIVQTEVVQVCDQDTLNRLYGDNNYKPLNQKYNVIYLPTQEQLDNKNINVAKEIFEKAHQDIVIRHYANAKPWNSIVDSWSKKELTYQKEFWYFAKMAPFFEGIQNEYMLSCISQVGENNKREIIKTINERFNDQFDNYTRYYQLFGHISLLTIQNVNNKIKVYLFGFIPLIRIKRNRKESKENS